MTVTVSWDKVKEKWQVYSTTEGHIGYRKTRKDAVKKAKGTAQTEATDRGTQTLVRWENKYGEDVSQQLVYPAGTSSEDRLQ